MSGRNTNYTGKRIEVDGNFILFDGNYNPKTKTLKVTKLYGDVTLFEEGLQNFCIEEGIGKVIVN